MHAGPDATEEAVGRGQTLGISLKLKTRELRDKATKGEAKQMVRQGVLEKSRVQLEEFLASQGYKRVLDVTKGRNPES